MYRIIYRYTLEMEDVYDTTIMKNLPIEQEQIENMHRWLVQRHPYLKFASVALRRKIEGEILDSGKVPNLYHFNDTKYLCFTFKLKGGNNTQRDAYWWIDLNESFKTLDDAPCVLASVVGMAVLRLDRQIFPELFTTKQEEPEQAYSIDEMWEFKRAMIRGDYNN